jgi:hypothetical protein
LCFSAGWLAQQNIETNTMKKRKKRERYVEVICLRMDKYCIRSMI